jgi:hypothetical protein
VKTNFEAFENNVHYPYTGQSGIDTYLNRDELITRVVFCFFDPRKEISDTFTKDLAIINRIVFRREDKKYFQYPFTFEGESLVIGNLLFGVKYQLYELSSDKLVSCSVIKTIPRTEVHKDNILKLPKSKSTKTA